MTTVRMLSNFIKQIPATKKKDILKGAVSGGTFGAIGAYMATDPKDERCTKIFTGFVRGMAAGAASGAIARESFTAIAKYLHKEPGNMSINIYNLYSAKVLGFLVGHRSAKDSHIEESNHTSSASLKI